MIRVGLAAPRFDCQAVVQGRLVHFDWRQVHENKRLILLFDSIEHVTGSPDYLLTLSNAVEELARLRTRLAVVCRDPLYEVLSWANLPRYEGGPGSLAFPLIVDADDEIACLYDLTPAAGMLLWGRFLIDHQGVIRQTAVSCFPVEATVEDLVRSAQASRFPAGRASWN